MRIAVVGAGGVGGYFGARLADAGADVVLVARGPHAAAIRSDGLKIESERGNSTVTVRVEEDPASIGVVDLVILAVKLWDTATVIEQIAPLVGPKSAVLSLQNGVVKDDLLREAFGADRTIGALCYISAIIARPGVIKHTGPLQKIVVGEYSGEHSERLETFAEWCGRAAIDVENSVDIERAIWEKFVFLVGLSGATSVIRQPIGIIRSNARARAFLATLFEETVRVGRARGVRLAESFAVNRLAFCDDLNPAFTSSMFGDLERGNRLEFPWLQGLVSQIGRKHAIATPANDLVGDLLSVYVDGAPAAVRA